jgi:hypothetical protein
MRTRAIVIGSSQQPVKTGNSMRNPPAIIREDPVLPGELWYNPATQSGNYLRSVLEDIMKQAVGLLTFLLGLVFGLVGGAALLAYAYQAAGLYPPDDATIKFIARERGWLKDDV